MEQQKIKRGRPALSPEEKQQRLKASNKKYYDKMRSLIQEAKNF